MREGLLAGHRYRLVLFLELAGIADAESRARAIIAEARAMWPGDRGQAGDWLLEQGHALRARARCALTERGISSLGAGLRARAERAGGGLAEPPLLFCDASLAGLARWLRSAGQATRCVSGMTALRLVAGVAQARGLLLTSDHRILEFGSICEGRLAALWLPSSLRSLGQLRLAVGDLDLVRAEPCCMSCGGRLVAVPKDSVRERIPPRTALWLDEYSLCECCGHLYWRGTHWGRIDRELRAVFSGR